MKSTITGRQGIVAVELYYTVQQAALLLGFCDKTIITKLKAGEFGPDVVDLGTNERPDYRLPASGINGYLTARRLFSEVEPIPARSVGELRRKADSPPNSVCASH